MDEVVDIIMKGNKVLVILSRKDRDVFERIKANLNEMHKNLRSFEMFDTVSLFQEPEMIREFFDGFSLMKNKSLFEEFGFKKYVRYNYSLENLEPGKKTLFSYDLIGRRQTPGLLQRANGIHLGKGVVVVPVGMSKQVETLFKKWDVTFTKNTFYRC